jgi:hypothetical protein
MHEGHRSKVDTAIDVEDVYLAYGRTMHAVQRLERTSLNVLGFLRVLQGKENPEVEVTRSVFDEAVDYVSKVKGQQKTLGHVFKQLYGGSGSPEFHRILKESKGLRDALAHSFIVDSDLKTAEGRQLAIEEIHGRERYFHAMCETTLGTFREALKTAGMSEPMIVDLIAKIDPGGPRRKAAQPKP